MWGQGWLYRLGARDFAGGIVIHTTAGTGALVIALYMGRRRDFDKYVIFTFLYYNYYITLFYITLFYITLYYYCGINRLLGTTESSHPPTFPLLPSELPSCGWDGSDSMQVHFFNHYNYLSPTHMINIEKRSNY